MTDEQAKIRRRKGTFLLSMVNNFICHGLQRTPTQCIYICRYIRCEFNQLSQPSHANSRNFSFPTLRVHHQPFTSAIDSRPSSHPCAAIHRQYFFVHFRVCCVAVCSCCCCYSCSIVCPFLVISDFWVIDRRTLKFIC